MNKPFSGQLRHRACLILYMKKIILSISPPSPCWLPWRHDDTQSLSRRDLPLDWRTRLRQFLHSLPRGAPLVVGNLLARRRFLQLDHRAIDFRGPHDPRSPRRPARGELLHALLDLLLRRALGHGRSDLRPDHAVPWHLARHGHRAGFLRRFRHGRAAGLRCLFRRRQPAPVTSVRHQFRHVHPPRRARPASRASACRAWPAARRNGKCPRNKSAP